MSHVSNHIANWLGLSMTVSACILAVIDGTSESPVEIISGEEYFEHRSV